jgi:hypothetical protein
MGRRVAQELHVQQNRPPWQRSVAQRARAETAWAMHDEPLVAGDAAISHGRECTIAEIDYERNTCVLDFTVGAVQGSRKFKAIGKQKGGARLSRPAISFFPEDAARRQRKDGKAEGARKDVEALFDAEGARSPSMRDEVRCRKGVGLYEVAQALMIYSTYAALYALFIVQYPMHKISFSVFKSLRLWYVRRAKREVCQCKHCENFRLYMEVLKALPVLFDPVINPPTGDAEIAEGDVAEADSSAAQPHRAAADEWASSERLCHLLDICSLTSKTDMVKACLCKGALEENKEKCIRGECDQCGLKKIWSEALKHDVVNRGGNIYETAPIEFQSTVKWEKVTSSKQTGGPGQVIKANACAAVLVRHACQLLKGARHVLLLRLTNFVFAFLIALQDKNEQDLMRKASVGKVAEFLDEFERDGMSSFPFHKYTILRQKATGREFTCNLWPGWLQLDVDFAENRAIITGREVQSEYWVTKQYTVFVQVVSWLAFDAWRSRDSVRPDADGFATWPPASEAAHESVHRHHRRQEARLLGRSVFHQGDAIGPEKALRGHQGRALLCSAHPLGQCVVAL